MITDRKVRPHRTSQQELDDLRSVIARDLADAAIPSLSSDRRFATAYNAALQTATVAIACSGYRVVGQGHHQTTFEAAELALGANSAPLVAYFDACRRKRNTLDYDRAHVATDTEASELLKEAADFVQMTEEWITQNHSQWKKV